MLYPYGFVPYSLKFSSVYLPYLLVNVCWNHGWHRYHGYTVLFRNAKLVHAISIHLIRVICGGSIRDEKRHIPADFSILPVNGYRITHLHYDFSQLWLVNGYEICLYSGMDSAADQGLV